MRLTLVRSATIVVEVAGVRLLVDPMFADAGVYPPYDNTAQPAPNPLVPLPMPIEAILAGIDAVIVTHRHTDHFDSAARDRLPRDLPMFCQPADAEALSSFGFMDVRPVHNQALFERHVRARARLRLTRVGGRHGSGRMVEMLGPVSGFLVASDGEPTVYIAGDTIWCDEVAEAIRIHDPDVVVLNAAGAEFLEGGLIVMGAEDVAKTRRAAPHATLIAVHLEALNHCYLSRGELRALDLGVLVPEDGETIEIQI